MTETRSTATSHAIGSILAGCVAMLAGCRMPVTPPPANDFVPFEGADVVQPDEASALEGDVGLPDEASQGVPVDRFIIQQLERCASRLPAAVCMGTPELLWFDGEPGRREGVAVVLLARKDVYALPPKLPPRGRTQTKKLLVDLMASVGGHVANLHRIADDATGRVDPEAGSFAQTVYAVLRSAGQGGRIQNANRWVIGSFRESQNPVEAFRGMFDRLWETCNSLRASEPVLIIGRQVLGEDDLRLRRLYGRANRLLDWPTYAGSEPDPGLVFSPKAGQP